MAALITGGIGRRHFELLSEDDLSSMQDTGGGRSRGCCKGGGSSSRDCSSVPSVWMSQSGLPHQELEAVASIPLESSVTSPALVADTAGGRGEDDIGLPRLVCTLLSG